MKNKPNFRKNIRDLIGEEVNALVVEESNHGSHVVVCNDKKEKFDYDIVECIGVPWWTDQETHQLMFHSQYIGTLFPERCFGTRADSLLKLNTSP